MGTPPSDQPDLKPSRARFVVLSLLCTLALITYLDRVCIMQVKGLMSEELRLDDIQMGWIFSAFLFGYAILEVPGGWMGDVWGARSVLTRIVLWWSLFTALTGCVWYFATVGPFQILAAGYPLLSSFGLLFLVRFLFGAGEAGAFPNITRVTRSWFPLRERGTAQGAVWMAARLGGAIAPAVTGALAAKLGWRGAFWVLGTLGLAWAAAFLAWFRDRPEDAPGCNALERDLINSDRVEQAPATGHSWPPLRSLVTSLTPLAMGVAAFSVCFPWYFYSTWQPKYYEDVFQLKTEDSGVLTGLPFFCGAAGALLGGWLTDRVVQMTGSRRWGRSLVGLTGFGGASFCILATAFATKPWQAATLLCLAFFINDLAIPTLWATFADVGGQFVGTLAGLMNMIGAIGGGISPILIPVVLKNLQDLPAVERWQYIFVGMATAWFVAAAAWLFIDAGKPLADGH
jgi:ACS family glucarate transporter-like MFS transporter